MRILIFGSNGFIGSNLYNYLSLNHNVQVAKISDSENSISSKIGDSDIIINASGVSRSENESDFFLYNVFYSQRLYTLLSAYSSKTYIYFSSIHYNSESLYGFSKRYNEFMLRDLELKKRNYLICLRIPGIFGPGMKPDYVSVVATFCYNLAFNKPSRVIEGDKILQLLYIDDLLEIIRNCIESKRRKGFEIIDKFKETAEISVSDLFKTIKLISVQLGDEHIKSRFQKNLFTTFRSYLK